MKYNFILYNMKKIYFTKTIIFVMNKWSKVSLGWGSPCKMFKILASLFRKRHLDLLANMSQQTIQEWLQKDLKLPSHHQ